MRCIPPVKELIKITFGDASLRATFGPSCFCRQAGPLARTSLQGGPSFAISQANAHPKQSSEYNSHSDLNNVVLCDLPTVELSRILYRALLIPEFGRGLEPHF